MNYSDYLQSEHWQNTRKKALKRAEYACQLCNQRRRLNVHHRTYERLGAERDSDLLVLCEDCHAKFHDKLPVADTQDDEDGEPWESNEFLHWHEKSLRSVAESGAGRWVELAWYTLKRKMGLSATEAVESVSRELNGKGDWRLIDDDLRVGARKR